jgi:hypothetical protein
VTSHTQQQIEASSAMASIITDELTDEGEVVGLVASLGGKEACGGLAAAALLLYYAIKLARGQWSERAVGDEGSGDGLPTRAWYRLGAALLLLAADYSLSGGYWRSFFSSFCLATLCRCPFADGEGTARLLLCGDSRAIVRALDLHAACTNGDGSVRWLAWFALLVVLWMARTVEFAASPLRGLFHAALGALGCSEQVLGTANYLVGISIRWVDYRACAQHAAVTRVFWEDRGYIFLAIVCSVPYALHNLFMVLVCFLSAGALNLVAVARQAAVARWHLDEPGYSVVGKSFHILLGERPVIIKNIRRINIIIIIIYQNYHLRRAPYYY